MSSNVINQVAYLRTSREFPEDLSSLALQVNKAYIDTANAVNNRTISIYTVNRPAVTGESWYVRNNQRQQGFRQVYTFTAIGNIAHGINLSSISQIAKSYGSYTDGTNYYGALYASNTAIAGQISYYVTATNIVVISGAGAPAISFGTIVLEWLSEP